MRIPSKEKFLKGIAAFEKREKRDAMYKVASFLMSHFWGKPAAMADGLGVLLLTWNQGYYRYGSFDFAKLERCIADSLDELRSFRKRDIFSLTRGDERRIKSLFIHFLKALRRIKSGKKGKVTRSPVAVAKALHMLAPGFFPLWDYEIARAYGCSYYTNPGQSYLVFCRLMRDMANTVKNYVNSRTDKTLLKLIDEYNYAKYTQGWI